MLNINDFLEIWKAIRDEPADISEVLTNLAKSEQSVSKQYFEDRIDQNVYATNDFKRYRKFLIDWYASHRTLTTTQRTITDPHSMTEEILDEQFASFGYDFSKHIKTFGSDLNLNKINFLLDLINLYKIKGTPESIVKALAYYNITNVELTEYFLKRSTTGSLIFESNRVTGIGDTGVENLNRVLTYNEMTENDPHWMYDYTTIDNIINNNVIALPSKTPYFSLRTSYTADKYIEYISVLQRTVADQYEEWLSTSTLPTQNAFVTLLNINSSLLELYLSLIYIYNHFYSTGTSFFDNYICYDGTAPLDYSQISTTMNGYIDYIPQTDTTANNYASASYRRSYRDEKLLEYLELFTREKSEQFLTDSNTAGTLLNSINPSLKDSLDAILDITPLADLVGPFLKDVDNWFEDNVDIVYPKLAYITYGSDFILSDHGDVINFFKPYRARLRSVEVISLQDNRLTDSIILDDRMVIPNINEYITETLSITDLLEYVSIRDNFIDYLRCRDSAPLDSTGSIHNELLDGSLDNLSSPYENLLNYNFDSTTAIDSTSVVLVTQNKVDWSINSTEYAKVYKDFGTDYFDGDFFLNYNFYLRESESGYGHFINTFANVIGNGFDVLLDSDSIIIRISSNIVNLSGYDSIGLNSDLFTISFNTTYYVELERDESIGTYGTVYLRFYLDSSKTTLHDSAIITLREFQDFRYLYSYTTLSHPSTSAYSEGYVEKLIFNGEPLQDTEINTYSGFFDFDSGGVYDCQFANDYCNISVIDTS